MSYSDAAQAYKQEAIASAPPVKVVRLLYQGALRFLDRAMASSPQDPRSHFVDAVSRADAIVTELRLALDKSQAPAVAESLERLYLFVEAQLQQALKDRRTEPLQHARKVLSTLLDGWERIELGQTEPRNRG
jgi:flagellar protein FliS